MGRQLRQQRRGGRVSIPVAEPQALGRDEAPRSMQKNGKVMDIIHAPGQTGPVAKVEFEARTIMMIAAEGMMVGQDVIVDGTRGFVAGNICRWPVPEGTLVHQHRGEARRRRQVRKHRRHFGHGGQQGRQGRTADAFRIVQNIRPALPGSIGMVAGGGQRRSRSARRERSSTPTAARPRYFKVKGVAMNPVDHPHGGGGHPHVGKPSTVSRNAPPGRKVGRLSPQKKKKER